MMFVLGMPMFFLLPFLVGQAKMQFAHSRARLMPQFSARPSRGVRRHPVDCFSCFTRCTLAEACRGLSRWDCCRWPSQSACRLCGAARSIVSVPMLIALVVFYSLLTHWGLNWWIIEAADHLRNSWESSLSSAHHSDRGLAVAALPPARRNGRLPKHVCDS